MSIDRDDILEALGVERNGFIGPALIGFGVGALVGATVALLLAPRRGSELRDELIGRAREMMGRGEGVGREGSRGESAAPTEPRNY
jgi:hypothetical protein